MSNTIAIARPVFSIKFVLSFICLAASAWILSTLPQGALILGIALVCYFFLLIIQPFISLLMLPAVIINFDLTPWLGWSLLNELDLFLLVSFAGVLLKTQLMPLHAKEPVQSKALLVISLWCTAWFVSFVTQTDWGSSLSLRPDQIFYFSETFALFQMKGPFYALLLFFMWNQLSRIDSGKATDALFYGAMFAAIVLFGAITWERGVWQDLFSSGAYYYRLSSLLDFTSRHRVTGLLSAMHTGGEAIDGSIILLMGLVAGGIIHFSGIKKVPFILAMFGLIYCLIATFTRTTYAAFFLMFMVAGVLILMRQTVSLSGNKGHLTLAAIALLVTMFCLFQLYRSSGYLGLAAGYMIISLGLITATFSQIRQLNRWLLALGYCAAIALGVYAQLTSKWITPEPIDLLIQFIVLVAMSGVAHALGGSFKISRSTLMAVLTTAIAVSFLILTTFASYRMSERLSSIDSDFKTRFNHWSDVMAARSGDWQNQLIGMGPGAFPLAYATTHPDKVRTVGSFALSDEEGLTLGFGRDLKFAQRLPILPNQNYQIELNTAATQASKLLVGMCERNYIFASKTPFNCSSSSVSIPVSNDHQVNLTINSKNVGEGSILSRWPTAFFISNQAETLVNIKSANVIYQGKSLVTNPNFTHGNHWYFYNDFEHLPWHMKNIPISLVFELGIVGFISTLLLIAYALSKAFKNYKYDSSIALSGMLVITGMIAIGIMGNPLDSPRLSMSFYWVVLITVLNKKTYEQLHPFSASTSSTQTNLPKPPSTYHL